MQITSSTEGLIIWLMSLILTIIIGTIIVQRKNRPKPPEGPSLVSQQEVPFIAPKPTRRKGIAYLIDIKDRSIPKKIRVKKNRAHK
jgi:hypothetical protein